jgi:hypothetical protein
MLSGCTRPIAWAASSDVSNKMPTIPQNDIGVYHTSINPDSGMLTGAYEANAPDSWSGMTEFASMTGTQPKIAVYYAAWDAGFNETFAAEARSHGAYVYVQLQPTNVSLASIADGDSDLYLREFANQVRKFGHPVILSFAHEMNGSWYSWGAGHQPAADFVAAWRHIVSIFRAQDASNAVWVWSVNSTNIARNDSLAPWWPGAAWVNWIGIDGYYYFDTDTYDSVFGQTIAQIRTFTNLPIMISETAVGVTLDRESQIAGLYAGARADHLLGVVWFDEAQDDGVYHQDWRLEDDDNALDAFKMAVGS